MVKKRILVVDDDTIYSGILKARLESAGAYEVRTESRATRAVTTALEFNPDLILLDVMMPELDGGEVAAQLEDDERLKDIPVVFLTSAVTREEVAAQDGLIGGRPFLAKPVGPRELLDTIEKYGDRSPKP